MLNHVVQYTRKPAAWPGFVYARPRRVNLRQLDRKYLGRESPPEDLQVTRTKGAFVYDARGRRYIDFLSGWCVGNFGWDNTGITKSPARRRPDYVYPEYLYEPWVELAQLLAGITPGKLEKTYRATGGSEAVDIALQIAMASTGRGSSSRSRAAITATRSARSAWHRRKSASRIRIGCRTARRSRRRSATAPSRGWRRC